MRKTKPDYRRIAVLELEIYGRVMTALPDTEVDAVYNRIAGDVRREAEMTSLLIEYEVED